MGAKRLRNFLNSPQGVRGSRVCRGSGPVPKISRRTLEVGGHSEHGGSTDFSTEGLGGAGKTANPTADPPAVIAVRALRIASPVPDPQFMRLTRRSVRRASQKAKLAAAGRVAGTGSRFLRGSAATGAAGGCLLDTLSSERFRSCADVARVPRAREKPTPRYKVKDYCARHLRRFPDA